MEDTTYTKDLVLANVHLKSKLEKPLKLKKKRKATKKVREAYKILSNKKTRKQYNNRYRKMKKKIITI